MMKRSDSGAQGALPSPPALARYQALCAKVDEFFARAMARHGAEMACGSGCHDCCHVQLTITAVEAAEIRAHLPELDDAARRRLVARAASPDPDRCVALEEDGRCAIYPARPLVCRSHGLPIRLRDPRGLPMIESCHRNFTTAGPAAADSAAVLDQTTLSTLLLAVDAAHAAERGDTPGTRLPLGEVVRQK